MSDPTLTNDVELDNLDLLSVSWNNITFECVSRELPKLKEIETWFVQTDKMKIGRAVCGKSEGLEPFKPTIPTCVKTVYRDLLRAQTNGTESDAVFTYSGSSPNVELTVEDCKIIDVSPGGGEENSTCEVKIQGKGGILKTATDSVGFVVRDVATKPNRLRSIRPNRLRLITKKGTNDV